jgi:hypothetical protein
MNSDIALIKENEGYHNQDLVSGQTRILSDGSWKQQRIVGIIPSTSKIPLRVALALKNLATPPNNSCVWIPTENMEVGKAYSKTIEGILNHPELSNWEYLLTMEHDNLPQHDAAIKLVKHMENNPHLAAIGGLYWTKGVSGVPQIWGDIKDVMNFRPQPPDPNGGLVECWGLGMGFTMFRLSMFKDPALRRPWFETRDGHTQDLWFWADARQKGYKCAVACDVKVGHFDLEGNFGPKEMVW